MTNKNLTKLERKEASLEAELKRRNAPSLSATEAQILAARGHTGRAQEPDYEEDRSKWSTSERQAFAARGVKPLRDARPADEGDEGDE
jgi:hypothetical protein